MIVPPPFRAVDRGCDEPRPARHAGDGGSGDSPPPASHHGEHGRRQGIATSSPQPDQHHKASRQGLLRGDVHRGGGAAGAAEPPAYHAGRERPASDLDRRGFLAEIATPPPKLA